MKKYKIISATEVKNRFGDYLGEVLRKQEPILIERHGKPVAVLVDLAQWERNHTNTLKSLTLDEDPWVASLKRIHHRIKNRHPHLEKFSPADLMRKIREEALR